MYVNCHWSLNWMSVNTERRLLKEKNMNCISILLCFDSTVLHGQWTRRFNNEMMINLKKSQLLDRINGFNHQSVWNFFYFLMRASGSKLGAGAAPNKYMIYVSETFWAGVPLNCSSFKRFNTRMPHTDKCDVNFAAITISGR